MRLLLDTHTLIWWWTDDARLSRRARKLIRDATNEIHVSAVSLWEMATKQRLGKLGLPDAVDRFAELMADDGFTHLPITWQHARAAGRYHNAHRDPFDRMLAVQAELEDLALVTADPELKAFPIQLTW